MNNTNDYQWVNKDKLEGLSDFQVISYLIYKGFKIENIDSTQKRVEFYFIKSKELSSEMNTYYNGEATVEPQRYSSVIRQLKTRLRNNI